MGALGVAVGFRARPRRCGDARHGAGGVSVARFGDGAPAWYRRGRKLRARGGGPAAARRPGRGSPARAPLDGAEAMPIVLRYLTLKPIARIGLPQTRARDALSAA